ncbi:MAG: hypothetical protein WBA13_02535 [Microcoleaceae cyanobacterium]
MGSLAISILSKLGDIVVSATGKSDSDQWLKQLGATTVINRDLINDNSGKNLLKQRWQPQLIPSAEIP